MNNATSAKHPVFLPLRPKTLISLWDMIQFTLSEREFFAEEFSRLRFAYKKSPNPQAEIPALIAMCCNLIKISERYHFAETKSFCERFKVNLEFQNKFTEPFRSENPIPIAVIVSKVNDIRDTFYKEMNQKKFAYIELIEFFEQKKLFGSSVYDSFPEARDEIKDAGNCLAADLNTAAVFHLMRVAEIGLRKLAKPLKIKLSCQIEFATWGNVTTAIGIELAKTKSAPRSKARDKKLQHYSQLLLAIQAFQHLWRDPVSHLRGRYDKLRARSAFNHVRTFMENLV